jgi:hypothetical protein
LIYNDRGNEVLLIKYLNQADREREPQVAGT